jgi:hypothetical protein
MEAAAIPAINPLPIAATGIKWFGIKTIGPDQISFSATSTFTMSYYLGVTR